MPDAMKTLYWIRHTQPEYPGGRRMCLGGKIDVPLSETGHSQAKRLGKIFADMPIEAVFCSPMIRTRQVAEYIAQQRCLITPMELLRELDGGVWDGMDFDEIRRQYPQHFIQDGIRRFPPGGESDEHGLMRAKEALSWLDEHVKESAVVIAHSGINRLLLSSMMGIELANKKAIHQEYGCVNLFVKNDQGWTVEAVALTAEEFENRYVKTESERDRIK